jgi:hypothetical protein
MMPVRISSVGFGGEIPNPHDTSAMNLPIQTAEEPKFPVTRKNLISDFVMA